VIELSKHVFEPLRKDEDSILYRGRKEEDSSHVLVLAPAIEAHHGWLWGNSNTPRGAIFQFTLPCQPGL